ncbi:MAG TPA: MBL fold metallo-hydrolase [Candidatus Saccharimonadales bacterium]|jgi:L-ascorbate metabolism protein UlaG (beta-lactamase superfamily)|nr:MBL fold metallo-hydrolase [Candidatus Saccharimonadales bacterium]
MDIQFHGANCVTITTKQARVAIDDNLADLGAKSVAKAGDIALYTGVHADPMVEPKIVIDQPGEYEVSGVSIFGVPARAHIDEKGQKNATIYKLLVDDLNVVVLGHVYPELSESQLERLGMVDVLLVPVGGNGYTLDGVGALALIKKIEPKLVIPTHYADASLQYPVPQQSLDDALKALAMEVKERTSKLRVKSGELGDTVQLVVVERA